MAERPQSATRRTLEDLPSLTGPDLAQAVGVGLAPTYRQVHRRGEEFWEELSGALAAAAARLTIADWLTLPVQERVTAWVAAHGSRADLLAILLHRQEQGSAVSIDPQTLVVDPGYLRVVGVEVPADLLVAEPDDLSMVARLERLVRTDDGWRLVVTAYVAGVDLSTHHAHVAATVVGADAGARPLVVRPRRDPRIDRTSDDALNSYADGGAEIEVPDGLAGRLVVSVRCGAIALSGPIVDADPHGVGGLSTWGPWSRGEDGLVTTGVPFAADPSSEPVILDVALVGSALVVHATGGDEVVLRGPSSTARLDATPAADSSWRFATDLRTGFDGGPPPTGTYEAVGLPARLAPDLLARVPFDLRHDTALIDVRRASDGGLELRIIPPYREDEHGRWAQRRLQDQIPALVRAPLRDAVLLESFAGRVAGDNPAALVPELARQLPDHPLWWGVRDHAVRVPDGARAVIVHSREWYELLHSSAVLVNNAHFPFYFRKHPGQFHVQTWHGTPLKRIGHDIVDNRLSQSYRALMDREAAGWDLLLAQNDFSAEVMPGAFGYAGRVLTTGYPRNDALRADAAGRRRESVRAELGLEPGMRAVLYAPTWRDGAKAAEGGAAFVDHLDVERLRAIVGADTVVLLRGHANTRTAHQRVRGAGVLDVTHRDDLDGLFLASDLLVTDYSSMVFDYAVTGKPVAFLAPDLDEYMARRGFYLDWSSIAPGPIVATTEELAEVISAGWSDEFADRYAQFVARFVPHDDGRAAQRVVGEIVAALGSTGAP